MIAWLRRLFFWRTFEVTQMVYSAAAEEWIAEVRFDDGEALAFFGDCTVWHDAASGRMARGAVESALTARWHVAARGVR